jgi:hypothetical protein
VTVPLVVVTAKELFCAPATVGVKVTGTLMFAPAATVVPVAGSVAVNAPVGAVTADTVSVTEPLFVSTTVWLALEFVVTLPNATDVGAAVNGCGPVVAAGGVMVIPLTAWMSVDAPVDPVNPT